MSTMLRTHRFLSTPSARRATYYTKNWWRCQLISIHALREEGDHGHGRACHSPAISIHALREEGDHLPRSWHLAAANFYPRPPRGGRPRRMQQPFGSRYFYPRPPRGGRRILIQNDSNTDFISIHALREEGDIYQNIIEITYLNFYPRPPRGGRPAYGASLAAYGEFLSTPSARRATLLMVRLWQLMENFYPRPPRGGRQGRRFYVALAQPISIHALREEGDWRYLYTWPTDIGISIHALREEGDAIIFGWGNYGNGHFYPRPPRGGRPAFWDKYTGCKCYFYPRPPRGGRLSDTADTMGDVLISIHALREEGDTSAVDFPV